MCEIIRLTNLTISNFISVSSLAIDEILNVQTLLLKYNFVVLTPLWISAETNMK